jgi:hypothetical protein
MEQKNAATHKLDAKFRPLRPDVRKQLEEDMRVSIVRNNADSEYNKSDEELFGDNERREILQRLSRIRNIYYDPISYRAAILTIKEAIEYSLKHDYPWLRSYEEACRQFNEGKIKYLGNIPKLYLGYGTNQVTDPQILAGIVVGSVQVIDKDEEEKKLRQRRREKKPYNPVFMHHDVIRSNEYKEYVRQHNMGIDTPISVILKSKSQLFDRLSMPITFVNQNPTEQKEVEEFDWFQPNAGEIFYCQQHGIKRNTATQLVDFLNKENNNELTSGVLKGIQDFMYAWKHPQQSSLDFVRLPEPIKPTDQAVALEQNLLASLRANNPNL